MYTAEVRFKLGKLGQRKEQIDAIGWLIPSWRRSGQIGSVDWVTAVRGARFSVFVTIFESDSLCDVYASKWVRQNLAKLADTGVPSPVIKILGRPRIQGWFVRARCGHL